MLYRLISRAFFRLVLIFSFNRLEYMLFGCAFGFRDNTKYLFLELLTKKNCFWVAKSSAEYELLQSQSLPVVMYGSKEWSNKVKNCKAAFFTHGIHDIAPALSKKTTTVNLWHGVPLKKMGYDSSVDLQRINRRKQLFLRDVYSQWDYLLASNEHSVAALISATRMPESKILRAQQPRNSILKPSLATNKLITYMPTFRDDGSNEHILKLLDWWPNVYAQTGYKLCLKLHPLEKVETSISGQSWLMDPAELSSSSDVQEILQQTEILITDYSSVMFDFATTQRKVIIYAPDISQYLKLRGDGFYISLEKLDVFSRIVKSEANLIDSITSPISKNNLDDFADDPSFVTMAEHIKRLNL